MVATAALAIAVGFGGCASTGATGAHCSVSELRLAAEAWLPVVAMPETEGQAVATTPTRAYSYDQALLLLWATWTEQHSLANGLARTLSALQRPDGSWDFWFDLEAPLSAHEGSGYVRNGATAWAVHALAYHAASLRRTSEAAERGADFLVAARADGLVQAGSGVWRSDGSGLDTERQLAVAVTEHQLDAWMALTSVGRTGLADELRESVIGQLWLEPDGYLAVARGAAGVERERALDAAGGWGALWLAAAGHEDLARRSLGYVLDHFTVPQRVGVWGQRPYLDRVDDWPGPQADPVIFTEGSLGVGMAALRLGRPEVADRALTMARQLACPGPRAPLTAGVPGANRNVGAFSTTPSVASTVWFLLLERERRIGQPAPVFQPEDVARDIGGMT